MVACGILKLIYEAFISRTVSHKFLFSRHSSFSVLFLFSSLIALALNWVPPPNDTLKVNVHGTSFDNLVPNGKISGIGVALCTSNGTLLTILLVQFLA